jgi:hypothetical protein
MNIKAGMLRRFYKMVGATAALLLVAVCLIEIGTWMLPYRPGVTQRNFNRIAVGMTKAEVEEIFGNENEPYDGSFGLHGPNPRRWQWDGDHGRARILFGLKGEVVNGEWWTMVPADEDLLTMLSRRFHGLPPPKSGAYQFVY